MGRPGTWPKGQSGNPNGRPKKNRALTEILRKRGSTTLEDADGTRRAGKRIVARLLWEGATTGAVTFPGGRYLKLGSVDWKDIVKFLYAQIDGPPKSQLELSGDVGHGSTITGEQRNATLDDLARRYSELGAPGEDGTGPMVTESGEAD